MEDGPGVMFGSAVPVIEELDAKVEAALPVPISGLDGEDAAVGGRAATALLGASVLLLEPVPLPPKRASRLDAASLL
jgi:hypothetical protein